MSDNNWNALAFPPGDRQSGTLNALAQQPVSVVGPKSFAEQERDKHIRHMNAPMIKGRGKSELADYMLNERLASHLDAVIDGIQGAGGLGMATLLGSGGQWLPAAVSGAYGLNALRQIPEQFRKADRFGKAADMWEGTGMSDRPLSPMYDFSRMGDGVSF